MCVYKEFWITFQVRRFLKDSIKFSQVSIFAFIVEPFRELFPYLKTDLNQNYPHNFSDMKI